MKSRIASALVVVACVGALTACSGKSPSGVGVTATTTTAPGVPGASSESSVGRTDSQGVAGDPDGDLSSIDQQLSDINGALSSAEPTQTAGDN
ncbi:hypothetical protein ABH920_000463 [Catenulispora sp. EB89]|uniref:hypothetical protein n=1 Tax=Catenulispora sp. EB89 TaxID=3156257 RepID=UPI0035173D60